MRLNRLQFAFTFQLYTGVVMVIRDGVKIFCRYDILYDVGIRTPQFSLINANTVQNL